MKYLYHVTQYGRLASIAAQGLRASAQPLLWLHFTTDDGLPYWFSYVAVDDPDLGTGPIPVVLRTDGRNVRGKVEDVTGSRDAEAGTAYKTTAGVPPHLLEVWTGDEWVPVHDHARVRVDLYDYGEPNFSALLPDA